MQSFKKLLESVRSANPGLITEEAANEMLNSYEAGINQVKADALAEGQALGFKEGYDEGKRIASDEAKKSLDALVEQLDQEATEKLKSVLDMLNEQHAEKLQEIYDSLKQNYVPVSEYNKLDSECAEKLQEVYDKTNEKNANMMQSAFEAVQKKNDLKMEQRETYYINKLKSAKLLMESKFNKKQQVLEEEINKYKAEKENKLNVLAEQVEKFINYALNENIPVKQLVSEQKYIASQKTIEKITSLLKINNILQESKDGIFADYEEEIKKQKQQASKLIIENADLKSKLEKQEAALLLEQKCQKCIPAEAAFLRTYFKNADSSKVIEEQIDEAKAVFKRLHDEKRKALVAESSKTTKVKPSTVVKENKDSKKIEPAEKKVVTESKKGQEQKSFTDVYAELLKIR